MTTRRDILKYGAAAGALAPFASMFGALPARAATDLRLYWWGSQDRARRTLEVAALFNQRFPDYNANGETVGADYWPKLSTMMVGRNLPDVYQLEPNTMPDYARRGACYDLSGFLGSGIKTDKFAPGVLDLTTVDGKPWGIALGLNSFSIFYDTEIFASTGLTPPAYGITWDELGALATEMTKAANKPGFAGMPNGSRYNYLLDPWLRQRGKRLFTEDGKLGFTEDDAKAWYDYWDKLQKAGALVAPDTMAADTNSIDTNAITAGKCALAFTYSNQLEGYQGVIKQPLEITTLPVQQKGGELGMWYRPALIWSVGQSSGDPEGAAKFIDFFVNDPDAGLILGVERGVNVNVDVRAKVAPTLNPIAKKVVDYVGFLEDKVTTYPFPAPKGYTEFDQTVMRGTADELAFGRIGVADAAKRLIEDGTRAISQ